MSYKEIRKSSQRFLAFRDELFDFIGDYSSTEKLVKNPPACDIYIAGSDQVWNPQIAYDEAFYFTYIDNKRKASYAASIGIKAIPENIKSNFAKKVKSFDYISVREKQAQSILEEMGVPSVVAPDPTLLFDKDAWNEIAIESISSPYILCYFVSFPVGIENIVKQVKNYYGFTVVNLMTSEESCQIGDIKVRDAGPREFLGLFKNASFIITSSFHGTVFSIINRKQFVSTLYNSTSSRVVELLNNLGLSRRIISPDCTLESDIWNDCIYTTEFEVLLSNLKNNGTNILNDIIIGKSTRDSIGKYDYVEPELKRIPNKRKDLCTGCAACSYICPQNAIEMKKDAEGYWAPSIDDEKCINCGKCLKYCHLQNNPVAFKNESHYAVKLKNAETRMKSRSGGAFVAISDVILERGGIVFGAIINESFEIVHAIATNKAERNMMCGSKYVQSNTNDVYSCLMKWLNTGKPVLFTGSACQVAAVETVFNPEKYPNLYLCDYICHGVPSPGLWEAYVKWIENKYHGKMDFIDFRDKYQHSWESHIQRIGINGVQMYSKRFTNLFTSNNCLRQSCYSCPYATKNRISDFTLGDYWGINDVLPDFNDGKGVSILFIRTSKGQDVFERCKNQIEYVDTTQNEPGHYNLKCPTKMPPSRSAFWDDYRKNGFEYVSSKYGRYDLIHRLKYKIKDHID